MKVIAKVSQYHDYEALYKEMKERYEADGRHWKDERDNEVLKDSYVNIIHCKDQTIEQQGHEIADLKRQLAGMHHNVSLDVKASTSLKPLNESRVDGYRSNGLIIKEENDHTSNQIEQQWIDRMESITAEHAHALDALKSLHNTNLMKCQQSELKSKQELITAQVLVPTSINS